MDLTKAFGRLKLKDAIEVLEENEVLVTMPKIIKELNTGTSTRLLINTNLTYILPLLLLLNFKHTLSKFSV